MKLHLKKVIVFALIWSISIWILPVTVIADSQPGAYLERVSFNDQTTFTWYLPAKAELIIVDSQDGVIKSVFDAGQGEIITAIPNPDTETSIFAAFYSDGTGLSSRTPIDFSQTETTILLPPTIYSIPNINGQTGSLGFVGSASPQATIELEIGLSTNEKKIFNTLANTSSEWQILPEKLPPGKHQAKARTVFQGKKSLWSQEVNIVVLPPTDQFIQDLGTGTRRSIEDVFDRLPGPLQQAAKSIDTRSEYASKYILPTLLTLSTLTQSGILIQNGLYVLFQAVLALAQLFGLVKKRQPMGVVYDAVTKRPLGRAIVRLYEATTNKLIETDVSSSSGTFSFMPSEGFYYLRVIKPGYLFPSELVLSKRDGKYTTVYSGGDIHVTSHQAVVDVAIPMDPEAYQETWSMKFVHIWQRWAEPINTWLLWFGFFLALLAYTRTPTRLNFVILWFYIAGLAYFWRQGRRFKREYGMVLNQVGKPISGVELVLMDTEYNRLVSRRVSDDKGRYQFMAPPGRYQIRVVTPAYEIVKHVHRAYQAEELHIEGERGQAKQVIPKIVVRQTAGKSGS